MLTRLEGPLRRWREGRERRDRLKAEGAFSACRCITLVARSKRSREPVAASLALTRTCWGDPMWWPNASRRLPKVARVCVGPLTLPLYPRPRKPGGEVFWRMVRFAHRLLYRCGDVGHVGICGISAAREIVYCCGAVLFSRPRARRGGEGYGEGVGALDLLAAGRSRLLSPRAMLATPAATKGTKAPSRTRTWAARSRRQGRSLPPWPRPHQRCRVCVAGHVDFAADK